MIPVIGYALWQGWLWLTSDPTVSDSRRWAYLVATGLAIVDCILIF